MPPNDPELLDAAELVVRKLRSQARDGRNIVSEITGLFRPYISVQATADSRTRKWAVSLDLIRDDTLIYRTPARQDHGGRNIDMGRWASCIGMTGVAAHIRATIAPFGPPEEFTGPELDKALQQLRGPITAGKGTANMRRVAVSERVRTLTGGQEWRQQVTWHLFVTVMREELAPPHRLAKWAKLVDKIPD